MNISKADLGVKLTRDRASRHTDTHHLFHPVSPGSGDSRAHVLMPATLVVAFLLATSKWGSYIGQPPIFLTDVLIGFAALHMLATWMLRPAGGQKLRLGFVWLVVLLLGWSSLRLLAGTAINLAAVRDFAPYGYSFLAIMSAIGYQRSTPDERERTVNVLWASLVFHTCWMMVAKLLPGVIAALPTVNGVHLFHTRTDIDGSILGITAAVGLYRWAGGKGSSALAVAFMSWFVIFLLPSRATLLGASLAAGLALLAVWTQRTEHRGRLQKQLVALSIPVVLIGAVAFLPETTVGTRLLTTFDQSSMGQEVTGRGTAQARERAWTTLTEYILDSDGRAVAGVGFGPDFMLESGALRNLLGDRADLDESGVRSPHNYFLGTWARLGVAGLILVMLIGVAGVVKSVGLRHQYESNGLLMLSGAIVVGLLPAAFFGVVFESPFGAIPFYWSIGILFSAAVGKRPDKVQLS